jgi:hypothetical protein
VDKSNNIAKHPLLASGATSTVGRTSAGGAVRDRYSVVLSDEELKGLMTSGGSGHRGGARAGGIGGGEGGVEGRMEGVLWGMASNVINIWYKINAVVVVFMLGLAAAMVPTLIVAWNK